MEQGLLWLPLLFVFGLLTWLGWLESQKLAACRSWATQFKRSKYDVLAILGWTDRTLIWGIPTRTGPTQLQSVQLEQLRAIQLQVEGPSLSWPQICQGQTIRLVLWPQDQTATAQEIPFTERQLAIHWWDQLNRALNPLNSSSNLDLIQSDLT